jgi:hypothetical protein
VVRECKARASVFSHSEFVHEGIECWCPCVSEEFCLCFSRSSCMVPWAAWRHL